MGASMSIRAYKCAQENGQCWIIAHLFVLLGLDIQLLAISVALCGALFCNAKQRLVAERFQRTFWVDHALAMLGRASVCLDWS